MYEIITPATSSMTGLLSRTESKASMAMTTDAPSIAAQIISRCPPMELPDSVIVPPMSISTMATARFAPLSTPRIDGPASGLRRAVCKSSPEAASPAPHSMAVSTCGTRL